MAPGRDRHRAVNREARNNDAQPAGGVGELQFGAAGSQVTFLGRASHFTDSEIGPMAGMSSTHQSSELTSEMSRPGLPLTRCTSSVVPLHRKLNSTQPGASVWTRGDGTMNSRISRIHAS